MVIENALNHDVRVQRANNKSFPMALKRVFENKQILTPMNIYTMWNDAFTFM